MTFERIVLWCEFPQKVSWKDLNNLLLKAQFSPEIYVACTSFENYRWWAREIKKQCPCIKEINAWPVLTKTEGYWFSGFTKKDNIDRLLEYRGTKIKIDLEPPFPNHSYTNFKIAKFILGLLFKKGKNNKHLRNTITELSKTNDVLVNEFPLPKIILKRWGCYYPPGNKNVMCYTSLIKNKLLKKILRWWNFNTAKKRKASMCSLGLIHSGIFGNEPYYETPEDLVSDMRYAMKKGVRQIAVYSLDSIMRRKEPSAWLSALKAFS